ncbi:response regulator transcription factor [Corynebacterium sp.]|uniref:response regulator transcription factor n=1 Tax=Corynebacterium sp. TaxID=1720 RepID=UPI003B3B3593
MPAPRVRLLIVDDDPLVLSSLRLYFGSPAGDPIEVVGEVSTGQCALDILDACRGNNPVDVVLADIHLPGMDGVELLEHIRELPSPPVFVAMTALDEEETMLSVLAGGGRGYILKSSRPEFIIDTVLATANGGTVVSPQPASNLVRHLAPETSHEQSRPELPRLSAAEETILSLVCVGLSNAEISRKTGRSSSMVKKQVSQLLGRFGASTRVQLAVLATEAGFRPDDVRG